MSLLSIYHVHNVIELSKYCIVFGLFILLNSCEQDKEWDHFHKSPIHISHASEFSEENVFSALRSEIERKSKSGLLKTLHVTNTKEDFPKKAWMSICNENKFTIDEAKEITSNYKKLFSSGYQKIQMELNTDSENTCASKYFIIEYSGKDLKTERIIKSDNPLLPVIKWFSSLWPQ